jgi:hypothetical protein
MGSKPWISMTREERMNEVGTEPTCPFCQRPRVTRSDYIRCNRCGVNWLQSEMDLPNYLDRDPRVARKERALTESTAQPTAGLPAASVEDFMVPMIP